jgi:membrane protein DedA with SNARE-associated domain
MSPARRSQLLRGSIAGLAALTVARWVGIALVPTLLKYSPLLLVALSPVPAHVVLAATVTPMVPLVAVTSLRRIAASVLVYCLGLAAGENGIPWVRARYPNSGRLIDRAIAMFEFVGPLVLFALPLHLLAALAGATRISAWVFVPAISVGHVMWAYLTYRVGESFKAQIAPIMHFLQEHMLKATLAFILFAIVYGLVQRKRQRAAASALSTPANSTEV